MPWSLTLNGTAKTFAEWKVNTVQLHRSNLQADILTFINPRRRFDDDELCGFGDEAILTDPDGVVWFKGTRQIVDREATTSQHQIYQFIGPWRFLAENVFQQLWGGSLYTSHLILNSHIGHIIKTVLDRAIAQGADLQYVQADLDALTALPVANEITGQLMETVILNALQFAPDVQSRFDYSTTPPTLRFQKRDALAAVSLRLADYDDSSMPAVLVQSLRSRPDLQVPSVKINYETIVTTDGVQTMVPGVEIWPVGATGLEDGAFTDTVILQGRTTTNIFGEIECQTIDPTNLEWLKQHIHTLRDPRVTVLAYPTTLAAIERLDEDGNAIPVGDRLPRELIFGTIAAWMRHDNDDPVLYQRETFRVKISYQSIDDADAGAADQVTVDVKDDVLFTFELVTTDAPDGVTAYSAIQDIDFGDPPISGLARYLYEALNPLQYDGSLVLQERECSGAVNLGHVLNLYGSRAEYQAMRALIQRITYNIDSGTTNAIFGPPAHLTLGALLALFERFRTSRRWTNPDTQETGEVGGDDSGDLRLGKATANTNTIPGGGLTKLLTLKDPAINTPEAPNIYIKLAIEDLMEESAGQPVFLKKNAKFRVVTVCILNANGTTTEMKAGVLMTEPWPIG